MDKMSKMLMELEIALRIYNNHLWDVNLEDVLKSQSGASGGPTGGENEPGRGHNEDGSRE